MLEYSFLIALRSLEKSQCARCPCIWWVWLRESGESIPFALSMGRQHQTNHRAKILLGTGFACGASCTDFPELEGRFAIPARDHYSTWGWTLNSTLHSKSEEQSSLILGHGLLVECEIPSYLWAQQAGHFWYPEPRRKLTATAPKHHRNGQKGGSHLNGQLYGKVRPGKKLLEKIRQTGPTDTDCFCSFLCLIRPILVKLFFRAVCSAEHASEGHSAARIAGIVNRSGFPCRWGLDSVMIHVDPLGAAIFLWIESLGHDAPGSKADRDDRWYIAGRELAEAKDNSKDAWGIFKTIRETKREPPAENAARNPLAKALEDLEMKVSSSKFMLVCSSNLSPACVCYTILQSRLHEQLPPSVYMSLTDIEEVMRNCDYCRWKMSRKRWMSSLKSVIHWKMR